MADIHGVRSAVRQLATDAVRMQVPVGRGNVAVELALPNAATALVIFAHGSGSGLGSPRNQAVARVLRTRGIGTLLVDLLTPQEEAQDHVMPRFRFDTDLLGRRLAILVDWVRQHAVLRTFNLGLFGASSGAAAALIAAADRPDDVAAVVSRGGRTDMASAALPCVVAPTLLLVGGSDAEVVEMNECARTSMSCPVSLEVIEGASHLFSESGALSQVAARASEWFARYLGAPQWHRVLCRQGTC
jgi:pimeloyl-ACP methyl ester carboxylesterase